jgi:hypothetical protein
MDHMATGNPFTDTKRRPHTEGPFHANEVSLANRNSGILLEALRHDVTAACSGLPRCPSTTSSGCRPAPCA